MQYDASIESTAWTRDEFFFIATKTRKSVPSSVHAGFISIVAPVGCIFACNYPMPLDAVSSAAGTFDATLYI